ncbi:hypothetical protein THAOC_35135 [Thalassiosira oceanica]|uniref:RNA-editing substrate-binding complex 6 protein domain-containing protein n=1 Tax=Thalassiosira oceanica TaxID=159749 RepID=K0RI06_THAOC|nr:hypothetical protein THAOC_35135 [Thalassiosira oceanica]|eukprot:EJK46207.1 hypothetical protein THAOC_35135 [Thalassiosira oceanica]
MSYKHRGHDQQRQTRYQPPELGTSRQRTDERERFEPNGPPVSAKREYGNEDGSRHQRQVPGPGQRPWPRFQPPELGTSRPHREREHFAPYEPGKAKRGYDDEDGSRRHGRYQHQGPGQQRQSRFQPPELGPSRPRQERLAPYEPDSAKRGGTPRATDRFRGQETGLSSGRDRGRGADRDRGTDSRTGAGGARKGSLPGVGPTTGATAAGAGATRRIGMKVEDVDGTEPKDGVNGAAACGRGRGATSMQGRGPDFRTCQTVVELAGLACRSLDSMSNRAIAAFWSGLPRLLHKRGAQDPNLEENLRCVIGTTCTRMHSFQSRDLAQTSLGIAKTISQVSRGDQLYQADDPCQIIRGLFVKGSQCSSIFDRIASSAAVVLNEFEARHLSNLIYSFGLVELNPDIGGETLFNVFGKTAVRILQTFKPQELSNMLWAFVKVDAKNSRLFQETGGVISGMDLDSFKPQEQSNILWSFAKSGEANPELFRVLGNHIVARRLNDFQPQHLSNIAWAFATAGVSHPILFKKIRDHIAGQDRLNLFNPQNLSNITWAFATAGDSHPEVFKKIGDHIAGLNSLDSFKAQALSNIAWAYSVANVPSEGLFNECFAGACSSKEETFPEEELRQLHQWQLWQQELKSGMELPHSLKEKCRNAFISSSYSESKLQNDVVDELKAIGLDLEVEVLLESGYRVDALVKFSDGGN